MPAEAKTTAASPTAQPRPWSGGGGYPIARSNHACTQTGEPFTPGQPIVAALIENLETRTLERRDFSVGGWEIARVAGAIREDRVLGTWKTTASTPGVKPKPILDDEAMLDLFSQTEGAEGTRANLRLVLALLMTRRRLLVHEGNKGGTMLVRIRGTPRPPEGPPLLEVPDPGVSEASIAETLAELEALGMSGDAPADAGAAAPAGGVS